jgi:hypothetical protein
MKAEYPKREPFFAHKAMRLMMRTCLINEIGHGAFSLLVVIGQTEDSARYRRPITWYDEQLVPVAGFSDRQTLARARDKAVKSGWLHYEHGKKGVPGKYWITIPQHARDIEDSEIGFVREHYPTEPEDCVSPVIQQPCGNQCSNHAETNAATAPEPIPQTCGKQYTLIPNPKTPNPIPEPIAAPENFGKWDLKDSDLKDTQKLVDWLNHTKLVEPCHENELKVIAAAERALSVDALGGEPVESRVAYFVSIVRDGLWRVITDADRDRGKLRHITWSRANRSTGDPLGLAAMFQSPDQST